MRIKLRKKTRHTNRGLEEIAQISGENEARMHLGRCKNCGSGWTKTNYLDELEPNVSKYFRDKGYAYNADICPKCVAAAKKYLAQDKAGRMANPCGSPPMA